MKNNILPLPLPFLHFLSLNKIFYDMKEYRVVTKGAVFVDGVLRKGFFAEEKKKVSLLVITPDGDILCEEIGEKPPCNFYLVDWGSFCQLFPKSQKRKPYEIIEEGKGFFQGVEISTAIVKEKELFFFASLPNNTILFPLRKNEKFTLFNLWDFGIIGVFSPLSIHLFSLEQGELIFDGKGEIVTFEKGFSITKNFDDSLQRRCLEEYYFSPFSCNLKDRKFSYAKIEGKSKLPLLLVEAIMSKDYEKGKEYLSYDLCEQILEIEEYVGKIQKVIPIPPHLDNEDCLAILSEDGVIKILKCEISNHLIQNLDILKVEDIL